MARTGKRRRRRNRAAPRRPPSSRKPVAAGTLTGVPQPELDSLDEDESWFADAWQDSRAGSRAGRGFHFQDAVGAWLASRLASGDLAADLLMPEGFDDLQVEATDPVQVEVKSRQGRLGPFPVGVAASHIVDASIRHSARFGTERRLVIVLEQGLAGLESGADRNLTEIPIAQMVAEVDGLGDALAARVASQGQASTAFENLKIGTAVVVCSWDDLTAETDRHVGRVVTLPPAALRRIGVGLRSIVADAVDANAAATFENRTGLDRTCVVDEINKTAELIDLESIEHALTQGICGLVDKEPVESGDAYYEGISTQPGHVGAGLVVPRPELLSDVLAGLEMSQAVLLAGPSGVGKSAVLWTLPFARPGVLWLRVHRISDGDLPHLMRLLHAYGASPKTPVGLLVDAAGRGDLEGWSRLRQSVAAVPGALLVGTARSEDLFSLGDLADCRVVKVSLDEKAAATIHAGLTRRGATTVPHWQEAFEQSHKLTLEFTHLLTHGSRLERVLADQIADRVHQDRALELSILARVTAADRWSASIPIEELESALGPEHTELRAALERLKDEHLLVERDGVLAGVHQIRSRGIVDVIHKTPPPRLEETAVSVVAMLRGPPLSRFVYEVLREVPSLEAPVLGALEGLVHDDVERLVACLRALELLDFYRQASAGAEVAEHRDVPLAHGPIVLWFALAGIELPNIFPDQLRNAIDEIAALPEQSATRDALLRTAGLGRIASELAAATSPDTCQRLLRALRRTTVDWAPLLASLEPSTTLVDTLGSCSVQALGDCVSAARDVSLGLARAFVDAIGGSEAVFDRFRNSDPWIRELDIASVDGELVGVAKFLYVSESEQGDARARAVEIGQQLLRALPDIEKVDVKPVLTGGRVLETDGDTYASSGLWRQYDHHPGAVRWNQERMGLVHTLFGASETERLAEAAGLLAEAAHLVRDVGNAFVRSRGPSAKATELVERCTALGARGHGLPPRFGSSPLSGGGPIQMGDDLSFLITNVCDSVLPRLANPAAYVAVSAFINGTVLGRNIPAVRNQPWRLLGLEGAPPVLDDLSEGLSEIDAVLTELSADPGSNRTILNIALSGMAAGALARAADRSRRRTRRRDQERRQEVATALRSRGLAVDVFWSAGDRPQGAFPNFAVTVAVESLTDWPVVVEELVPRLEALRTPGESSWLVPVLGGRTVRLYAKPLISELWPVTDFSEFEHLLPHPLEERLTTEVVAAHSALQVRSALSALGREDGLDDQVIRVLDHAQSDFKEAIAAIQSLGQDTVVSEIVDWLLEIDTRIGREWNGEIRAGTFAEGIAEGALGDGSVEFGTLDAALLVSLQWDADPASAVALIEQASE